MDWRNGGGKKENAKSYKKYIELSFIHSNRALFLDIIPPPCQLMRAVVGIVTFCVNLKKEAQKFLPKYHVQGDSPAFKN